MSEIKLVLVPQLGVNDERAEVVEWVVGDGDLVSSGDLICILETTKATYDVEADSSGYVLPLVGDMEKVLLGQPLAVIGKTIESTNNYKKKQLIENIDTLENFDIKATNKAIKLAKANNIEIKKITPELGVVIRESDIITYMQKSNKEDIDRLDISLPKDFTPVVVYGAGAGAITIMETLSLGNTYRVVCFVDDNPSNIGDLFGIPVLHSSELPMLREKNILCIATEIMQGRIRLKIKEQVEGIGFQLINVIHPSAQISPSVKMGVGNYIKAGAVIETNTEIGDCCIIDNGAILAHDNKIESGCHIAPGAVFGSSIVLGFCSVVGIGASISTNVKIGRKCIVSVGTSVTNNIDENSVIEGVPGKIIGNTK